MKSLKVKTNAEARITIDHIGAKGDGVGSLEGKPVYVAKTAPGDVALVHLQKETEEGYRARLQAIETAGPERTEPPCPYFKKCGGCSLQHVTQRFYHEWKAEKIKTALERAGVSYETWEEPIFLPHATRRRATMNAHKSGAQISMGYNEARSHNALDIGHCMILEPALDAAFQGLRPYLPHLLPENKPADIMLQNIDGNFDMVLSGPYRSHGKFSFEQNQAFAELSEKLGIARISFRPKDVGACDPVMTREKIIKAFGKLKVEIPAGAFLQASQAGEDALVALAVKNAEGSLKIADLFCGCGTFAGNLLAGNRAIYAADGDPLATKALQNAAKTHKNLKAIRRDLSRSPLNEKELANFDLVIFDPPRAGASAQAGILAKSAVAKIIAVSCNPATFARDAKTLKDGGYFLKSVTLVDQFIWSAHVEIFAVFSR